MVLLISQTMHHMPTSQQLQQPMIQDDENSIYSKNMAHGRGPNTRHDGRKLFVGGLSNEVSKQAFRQFFQQYGEVIDSFILADRKTKRSRGFGYVTFADPDVAASFLNTIPGRTGVVKIMGKVCEVKACEPNPAEAEPSHRARPIFNSIPRHHEPPQRSSNHMSPQRVVFETGGDGMTIPRPLHVNQALLVPPNFITQRGGADGGERGGMSIYSHSTITRITVGPDGASHDGVANVYIQNNFYTLPPGGTEPTTHALTPEQLQAQLTLIVQNGGVATLGQTSPPHDTAIGGQRLVPEQKQFNKTIGRHSTWQH